MDPKDKPGFFSRLFHFGAKQVTEESIALHEKRLLPTIIGMVFVITLACFLFFSNSGYFFSWMNVIDDLTYDFQASRVFKALSQNPQTIIVAIDNKSIETEGRLPWSRQKMAELVNQIHNLGAKVVALDFMFPQAEVNIAEEVIQDMEKKNNPIPPELRNTLGDFDYDGMFAKSLSSKPSVLGMYFGSGNAGVGVLPQPIMEITPQMGHIYLPQKTSYIGNIGVLQNAAKYGGFINSTPDADGIIRFAPLIYQYSTGLYGSLSLIAVKKFLDVQTISLIAKPYEELNFLEDIQFGDMLIPIDPYGRILIPFRGPDYTFPQVSASDILQSQVDRKLIEGKLVFIGVTATGSGEFVPVAVSPNFPGIVIHAVIAQGILDHYLPFRPTWGKGTAVALILGLGLILAFFLPRIGPIYKMFLSAICIAGLLFFNYWLWIGQKIVISFFFPIFAIVILFLLDTIYGYVIKSQQSRAIKNIFGQYVSNEYIDLMMQKKIEFTLSGESKDLSILFSDIRNFTSISEKMTATELKTFLNDYLSAMTQLIFDTKGTIDKYIGDAIMAFWGAPLPDAQAALHAVNTALLMHAKLEEMNKMNKGFVAAQKPPVQIGIGIAEGVVYVGDMGSKFHRSYTVIGDDVNLASRLGDLTKLYSVGTIVSSNIEAATRGEFVYRRLDHVQVKGKKLITAIYEPICRVSEITPAMKEEIDRHHEALDAYARGDFAAASSMWEKLHAAKENKMLYSMYLDRLKKTPLPGPNWEGVQVYETK